jgi:antitoxin HigA-1
MDIRQNQLSRELGISPRRVNEIVHCKRRVMADGARKLMSIDGADP